MKRTEFLKLSGLSLSGFVSGLMAPTTLLAHPKARLDLAWNGDLREVITIDKNDDAWIGWLVRLVANTLVTALSAKLVDKWAGDCQCNGTSCTKNNADASLYTNTNGVYSYESISRRFLTQEIQGGTNGFTNMSVPFLDHQNTKLINVEGPFLAGICLAINDLNKSYGSDAVKTIMIPRQEISNGGYRFDNQPCYPTKFKTDYGTTEVVYNPTRNGADIVVRAKDEYDVLKWGKTYELQA